MGAFLVLLLCATWADAIDFKLRGRFDMGFGLAEPYLTSHFRNANGQKLKTSNLDRFAVRNRWFLWLDAVASESLSGTVQLHIGPQDWGKASQGAALGADGTNAIRLRQAYLDWALPDTSLRTRMGIQIFSLPSAATTSSVFFNSRAAAVNSHFDINEHIGLTALWFRPVNDNYNPADTENLNGDPANYLDNMDLFMLSMPYKYEGVEITPWVMYGIQGRNAGNFPAYYNNQLRDGSPVVTLTPYLDRAEHGTGIYAKQGLNAFNFGGTSKTYGSMVWAGLPMKFTMFEPWNFEVDFTYGYVEPMGRYDVMKRNDPGDVVRASTQRQGWLAKGLVEYKMDWAIPGIFGWYASGDDGNVKNGSERLPSVVPGQSFTSFLGDANLGWAPEGAYIEKGRSLAGTWGIGGRLRDISFIKDLKHTFVAAYFGGTNAPSMVKYMTSAYAWESTSNRNDGPYLTTNDGLLELDFWSNYKIYENLAVNLDLAYIANFVDNSTWQKNYKNFGTFEKQDAWKAQLTFTYTF